MKITIFNGGRGASSIINNLLSKKDIEITSIVNAYDDGKSWEKSENNEYARTI